MTSPHEVPRSEASPTGRGGFFAIGGAAAWATAFVVPFLAAATVAIVHDLSGARLRRDLTRLGAENDRGARDEMRREAIATGEALSRVRAATAADVAAGRAPYLVVSIADNRLWYKLGDEVLFSARVATGTGKDLEQTAGGRQWKFDTPRGRLTVVRKDVDPEWVPPDWHYIELAAKKGLTPYHLVKGKALPAGGGAVVTVSGDNVVMRYADGREVPFEVREGREIRVGRMLVIPPLTTIQRRYAGTLGSNRLYLGDGYGIHGTDAPTSIGRAASHGCVRLRNEDAELLYRIVPLGTPVYIY